MRVRRGTDSFRTRREDGRPPSPTACHRMGGTPRWVNERPMLEVIGVRKVFPAKRHQLAHRVRDGVRAVDGVSFDIRRGETFALVGESGCGKTTIAEVILHLQHASGGEIEFDGEPIRADSTATMRGLRRRMQVVFQNPRSSLNPRMRVADILLEPLIAQGKIRRGAGRSIDRSKEIGRLLELVGLDPSVAQSHPHALSGGQAQRVAIARALAVGPELIVLDEPTSALDVSVQAQILNLLIRLQAELQLTYLFISHDLRVVRNIADRIAVMYLGKIVELGTTASVFAHPSHPYSQALLSAVPKATPLAAQRRIILPGDVPNPLNIPSGCRFHTRCPIAQDVCRDIEPNLEPFGEGRLAACHFAGVTVRPNEDDTRESGHRHARIIADPSIPGASSAN